MSGAQFQSPQVPNAKFKPYIVNGKAAYYAFEFVFTAP